MDIIIDETDIRIRVTLPIYKINRKKIEKTNQNPSSARRLFK